MPDGFLEISLRRADDHPTAYHTEARFAPLAAGTVADPLLASESRMITEQPIFLDADALAEHSADPDRYGRALAAALFAPPQMARFWQQALAVTFHGTLRLRLRFDPADAVLNGLRWETLHDPVSRTPVARNPRIRLSRFLDSEHAIVVPLAPRTKLRALVVVSNPGDLNHFGLSEIDVDGEVSRALQAFDNFQTTIVGDHSMAEQGLASFDALASALASAPQIIYLICHSVEGSNPAEPALLLERHNGLCDPVPSSRVAELIQGQPTPPLLVVLASCRSAGGQHHSLALGPLLARAGVPAVIGFHGLIAVATARRFLRLLLAALREREDIDGAVLDARRRLDGRDWWQPVLWLSTRDGQIWRPRPPAPQPAPMDAPPPRLRPWYMRRLRASPANLPLLLLFLPIVSLGVVLLISSAFQLQNWLLVIGVVCGGLQIAAFLALHSFQGYRRRVEGTIRDLSNAINASDTIVELFVRPQYIPPQRYARLAQEVRAEIEILIECMLRAVATAHDASEKAACLLIVNDDEAQPDAATAPLFHIFHMQDHLPRVADDVARLTRANSLAGRALATGACQVLYDSAEMAHSRDNIWLDSIEMGMYRGHVAVPVLTRLGAGPPFGVLCLDVRRPLQLSALDLELLLIFADKIAHVYHRYY